MGGECVPLLESRLWGWVGVLLDLAARRAIAL